MSHACLSCVTVACRLLTLQAWGEGTLPSWNASQGPEVRACFRYLQLARFVEYFRSSGEQNLKMIHIQWRHRVAEKHRLLFEPLTLLNNHLSAFYCALCLSADQDDIAFGQRISHADIACGSFFHPFMLWAVVLKWLHVVDRIRFYFCHQSRGHASYQ